MGRVSESIKSLQSSTDHHSYHPHFRTQERQQQITDKVKMSEDKIDVEEILCDIKRIFKKNEGNIFILSLFFIFYLQMIF